MEELLATLTGLAVPALAQFQRWDDENQRKIRNNRHDVRDLQTQITELLTSGQAIRNRLPLVNDWAVGLGLATQQQPTAQPIPSVPSPVLRPNLCNGAESFISSMLWPPREGKFDTRGNVSQVGELSTTALAMTYEEVRAAVHGLILCNGSTSAQRVEIYRGINALIETIAALNLTKAQFAEAWGKIFAGQLQTVDPHRDPSHPPTISGINAGNNVASVVFLPTGGNGENNAQTDAGHRMRITATGGGPIGVGIDVATITFSTPYRYRRADGTIATMQPQVHISASSDRRVYAVVSSIGYTIMLADSVSASAMLDVSVIVEPGVATV
jgi:hypothetical protein